MEAPPPIDADMRTSGVPEYAAIAYLVNQMFNTTPGKQRRLIGAISEAIWQITDPEYGLRRIALYY